MTSSNRLKVYVQPRASHTTIVGLRDKCLHIRLTSPPVDNAANEALVRLLAARLGIARRNVRVIAGARSRHKVVEIDDVPAEVALSRLLAGDRKGR
jgi:uncharacterized protein (TIGR00251 family)